MNSNTMRNLTLASAKHLVSQGHITKPHHAKIMAKVKAPAMKQPSMQPPAAPKSPIKFGKPMGPLPSQITDVPMGALDAAPPKQGAGHYMGDMPTSPGDTSVDE